MKISRSRKRERREIFLGMESISCFFSYLNLFSGAEASACSRKLELFSGPSVGSSWSGGS